MGRQVVLVLPGTSKVLKNARSLPGVANGSDQQARITFALDQIVLRSEAMRSQREVLILLGVENDEGNNRRGDTGRGKCVRTLAFFETQVEENRVELVFD